MNLNSEVTIDQLDIDDLINFVLTDEYLTYGKTEIFKLKKVFASKVALISSFEEREFYNYAIDQLIYEMEEAVKSNENTVYGNPLKKDYDEIVKKITSRIENDYFIRESINPIRDRIFQKCLDINTINFEECSSEDYIFYSLFYRYTTETEHDLKEDNKEVNRIQQDRAINNILYK